MSRLWEHCGSLLDRNDSTRCDVAIRQLQKIIEPRIWPGFPSRRNQHRRDEAARAELLSAFAAEEEDEEGEEPL